MSADNSHKPENDDIGHGTNSSGTGTATEPRDEDLNESYHDGDFSSDGQDNNLFNDFKEGSDIMSLFKGVEGIFVMFGGVIIPTLLLVATCYSLYERITLLIIKHPIESIVEIALVLAIPIGNYVIWSNLVKCDYRSQIKRGLLNGVALGSALIIALVSITALFLKYPVTTIDGTIIDVTVMIFGSVFTLAAAVSTFLLIQVRNTRIVESGRIRALAVAGLGVLLSLVGFAASESREIAIKVSERMAISEDLAESKKGLETLRFLHPRKELNMECANMKAGGIPGMFVKLDNITLRQLYFQVTGEPFRDDKSANFSTMPDEYLSKHVVGQKISGLTLHRSKMLGHINPETLSSTVYWNFVFKNKNYTAKEARIELGLPEGAVISGMTVWKDGDAQGTMFRPTGTSQAANHWTEVSHQSPGAVADLGRGRVLLHCYPVPAQGQMRAAVAITVPAKLQTIKQASLPLPRIIEANFSMKGDHQIRMISTEPIGLKIDKVRQSEKKNGRYVITGHVEGKTISGAGVSVQVHRQETYGPVAVKDNLAKIPRYVVQTIKKLPAKAPKRLLIVLDGSESMKPDLTKIKNVISKISKEIDTSVILASNLKDSEAKTISLNSAMKKLTADDFVGGQDNLEAVVKATELAGESENGAVLWVHGPQPSFNKEIYIISPFQNKPAFFEMALDNGIMNSKEFFKHHGDIGPFTPIARSGSPAEDLDRFLNRWTPGGHEFVVEYKDSTTPAGRLIAEGEQARAVGAMYAKEKCALLLNRGELRNAVEEAVLHRIVTPVSIASSILNNKNTTTYSLAEGMHNRSVHLVDEATLKPMEKFQVAAAAGSDAGMMIRGSRAGALTPLHSGSSRYTSRDHFYKKARAYRAKAPVQSSNYAENNLIASGYAPTLSGATNGTIGPQGADATAIIGVNTGGAVRVNNLANLEALLNIIANGTELFLLLYGGAAVISLLGDSRQGSQLFFGLMGSSRFALGFTSLALGLSTPGMINWFYASARDANVFS